MRKRERESGICLLYEKLIELLSSQDAGHRKSSSIHGEIKKVNRENNSLPSSVFTLAFYLYRLNTEDDERWPSSRNNDGRWRRWISNWVVSKWSSVSQRWTPPCFLSWRRPERAYVKICVTPFIRSERTLYTCVCVAKDARRAACQSIVAFLKNHSSPSPSTVYIEVFHINRAWTRRSRVENNI